MHPERVRHAGGPLKLRPFRAYNFYYPNTQGCTLGFHIEPFQGKTPPHRQSRQAGERTIYCSFAPLKRLTGRGKGFGAGYGRVFLTPGVDGGRADQGRGAQRQALVARRAASLHAKHSAF